MDIGIQTSLVPDRSRVLRNRAWVIGITGVLAPWIVAVLVKLWLSSQGSPTLPWSKFLNTSLPLLVLGTAVQWSFPFILLALLVRFRGDRQGDPLRLTRGTAWVVYAAGMLGTVAVFAGVFWDFDFMYIFVPVGMFVAPVMLTAYGICRLTQRGR